MPALHSWVTDELREEIAKAKTIQELLWIAYLILDAMPSPIGMVCGPISTGDTGDRKANIAAIRSAADRLQRKGKNIFDQTIFDDAFTRLLEQLQLRIENKGWEAPYWLLEQFYQPLFSSRGHLSTLYFLPLWKTSFGAKWEHEMGKITGKKIVHLRK